VYLRAVDEEVVDAVVRVIVDLGILDDAAGLDRPEAMRLVIEDDAVIGSKLEIPNALAGLGVIGRAWLFFVVVAAVLDDEGVVRVDRERSRPFTEKCDAWEIGDFLPTVA
jgi:hypothetical protein